LDADPHGPAPIRHLLGGRLPVGKRGGGILSTAGEIGRDELVRGELVPQPSREVPVEPGRDRGADLGVREHRSVRVEHHRPHAREGRDVVPGLIADRSEIEDPQGPDGSVGVPPFDTEQGVVLVQAGSHRDRVGARPFVSPVVGVRLEDEQLPWRVLRGVVGTGRGQRLALDPPGKIGVSLGTGQKNGAASRCRKSPDGAVSVIVSVSPAVTRPEMCSTRPARKSASPTMSSISLGPGVVGPRLGDSARSREYRNVSAVTASPEGGEKRNPSRTRNV
jgi:hypothetical protein